MLQIENLTLHAPGSGEGTEPVLNAVSLHLEEGTTEGSDDEEYYDEDFDDSDEGASNR